MISGGGGGGDSSEGDGGRDADGGGVIRVMELVAGVRRVVMEVALIFPGYYCY